MGLRRNNLLLHVPAQPPRAHFLRAGADLTVYTITTAEDKVEAAKHEGAITGAGIAGGAAGGALAGLMCGPGAPVCVTIGIFVGGAAAAFGVDLLW